MSANAELKEPGRQILTLLDCQRRVLELIGSGAPLNEVLLTIVKLIEELAPEMRCAIVLLDSAGKRLRFAAAPSIPEDFKACMAPFLRVGPDTAQCGRAAFWREPLYTEDTAVDPRWFACRDVALRNGLRAIWSTPVLSDDNTVLGTFTLFHSKPGLPDHEHVQLIDMAVQMARVAIQSKHDEERLRASDREVRDVIDNIPAIAWTAQPDGRCIFANRSWQEYTGQTPEESAGWGWKSCVHPEDVERHTTAWHEAVASGERFESEARYRRTDGVYRWFMGRGVPLRDERGKVLRWYGILADIDDRKRAEAALQKSERILREAEELGHTGGWEHNLITGEIFNTRENARLFFGADQTKGARFEDYAEAVHPEDRAFVLGRHAQLLAEGGPRDIEFRVIWPDGSVHVLRGRATVVKDDSGRPIRVYGTNVDITERVRAEKALRDSAQHLQDLSRRLLGVQEDERRKLARELHDTLGATLTALSINLAALKDRAATDREARVRINDSAALVKSTALAIEDMVAGLRPPMLDDHGIVAALNWYGRQFSKRVGVAISVQAVEPGLSVPPEVGIALFRIAQEALNNVAKHARAKRVAINLWRTDAEFVMSISDDGIGLPTDDTREPRGHGLGMVTMRERAQAVGARLDIESLPEGGTRVTVKVPL